MKPSFFFALCVGGVAALGGCSSDTCTMELRGYEIAVERGLGVAEADIDGLIFETCVDGSCETQSPQGGELGTTDGVEARLRGDVRMGVQGAYLKGRIALWESVSPSHVTVTVSQPSGAALITATGTVDWVEVDDQACHTRPVQSGI